jgi:hypothetical protein
MSEDLRESALDYHRQPTPGKIAVTPTKPLANQRDLSLAYSPGVAFACTAIEQDPMAAQTLTARGNLVAVITNGTAVLGLGSIGPLAAKPVMEGKGVLFKKFAGIDVFDIELDETDPDKLVDIIAAMEPTFGGINLEDIKAPECFTIEEKLCARMKIPVFHDDRSRGDPALRPDAQGRAAVAQQLRQHRQPVGHQDARRPCRGPRALPRPGGRGRDARRQRPVGGDPVADLPQLAPEGEGQPAGHADPGRRQHRLQHGEGHGRWLVGRAGAAGGCPASPHPDTLSHGARHREHVGLGNGRCPGVRGGGRREGLILLDDSGQVQPALVSQSVSHIGQPDRIRTLGPEGALEEVGGNAIAARRSGRGHQRASVYAHGNNMAFKEAGLMAYRFRLSRRDQEHLKQYKGDFEDGKSEALEMLGEIDKQLATRREMQALRDGLQERARRQRKGGQKIEKADGRAGRDADGGGLVNERERPTAAATLRAVRPRPRSRLGEKPSQLLTGGAPTAPAPVLPPLLERSPAR